MVVPVLNGRSPENGAFKEEGADDHLSVISRMSTANPTAVSAALEQATLLRSSDSTTVRSPSDVRPLDDQLGISVGGPNEEILDTVLYYVQAQQGAQSEPLPEHGHHEDAPLDQMNHVVSSAPTNTLDGLVRESFLGSSQQIVDEVSPPTHETVYRRIDEVRSPSSNYDEVEDAYNNTLSEPNLLSPIDPLPSHLLRSESANNDAETHSVNRMNSLRHLNDLSENSDVAASFKPQIIASPEESDRLILQDSLLRCGAIHRTHNDIALIKRALSRSKSTKADYSTGQVQSGEHGKPLLFSRNSVKRKPEVLGEQTQQLPINSVLFDDPEDLDQISELGYASSDKFNVATNESELNCLKDQIQSHKAMAKPNSPSKFMEIVKSALPFKSLYRAQDSKLNLRTADGETSKFLKENLEGLNSGVGKTKEKNHMAKRNNIFMWCLFMLLMIVMCICIPLIIILMRGSDSIVTKYLSNISPHHREELLSPFILGNNSTDGVRTGGKGEHRPRKLMRPQPLTPTIAGISKFENIPHNYQRSRELRQLMTNDNLTNVFYGIDYAPKNVISPQCGVTAKDVILDVALLSQVTSRIRTYGTQCNQTRHILNAIQLLHLNVSLSMGVWIGANEAANNEQIQELKSVLQKYPRELFESVYIGNEVLFREDETSDKLIGYIDEVKSFIRKELKWDLPVGTSELGSRVSTDVMKHCDFYGVNVDPFLNGVNAVEAGNWTHNYLTTQVDPYRRLITTRSHTPQVILSEVGWPYGGGQYRAAKAGLKEMQQFLDSFICSAKDGKRPWYFFEAFDEPWKQVYHRPNAKWETEWGLFTSDRKIKENVSIPKCL